MGDNFVNKFFQISVIGAFIKIEILNNESLDLGANSLSRDLEKFHRRGTNEWIMKVENNLHNWRRHFR